MSVTMQTVVILSILYFFVMTHSDVYVCIRSFPVLKCRESHCHCSSELHVIFLDNLGAKKGTRYDFK